jgi:hypothetical protein
MLKKDLRIRMDRWIVQARLAGGLDDESDAEAALRSAALTFASQDRIARAQGTRKWLHTGTQVLSVFMVAAANTPTGNAGSLSGQADQIQRIFANLAKNESCGTIKTELEWAAKLHSKLFASALLAFAV